MFNTLRPRQNGRHFADDILNSIFLNENVWILIKISLKFLPEGPIDNIPSLVQIMAWPRPGDKPLSEPMMVSLPRHICVTRPQWVNSLAPGRCGSKFYQGEIFEHMLHNKVMGTLFQVMALCSQSTNHYLSQYWCWSMSYGIIRQWVKLVHKFMHSVTVSDA